MKRFTSAEDTGTKGKRKRIVKSCGQNSGRNLLCIADDKSDSDSDGVNPNLPFDSSTARLNHWLDGLDSNLPSTSSGISEVRRAGSKTENKYSQFYKICQDANGKYGECLLCLQNGVTRQLKMKNSNTSGLKRHLNNVHTPTAPLDHRLDGLDPNLPFTSSGISEVPQEDSETENKYSQFYKICQDANGKYGKCLLCLQNGVTRQLKMTNSNTSGLQRHLKNVHFSTAPLDHRLEGLDPNSPSTSSGISEVPQADSKTDNKYSQFFKICQDVNGKYGKCLLCLQNGVTRQLKMKNSNTSGLRRHLKNVHDNESPVKLLESKSKNSVTEHELTRKTFDQRLVEWLAIKYLPFSFFDDDATQEFFVFLNKNETYPKRTSMREKTLQHFNDMRVAVFKTLKEVSSKFSLTIDGWTSIANRSYYGVTMHFIDEEWNLQSLPLDFIPWNGRHTGKDIANLVRDVLDEFQVKSRIQGITMDNAAANTTFIQELANILQDDDIAFDSTDSHFRCFGHILNLGVQDTLAELNPSRANSKSIDEFDDSDEEALHCCLEESTENDVVNKIRRLFTKIKTSEQWTLKLANCCEAVNSKMITPAIDVPARWNSTYKMLQTALNLKKSLNALLHSFKELRDMKISPSEWEVVETVISYLKPFDSLTTVLGGQTYVTLPLVIIGFNMLIERVDNIIEKMDEKLDRNRTDETLLNAFKNGRDKMLRHYEKPNWIYGISLILDPRHKVATFSMTSWGQQLKEESIRKFESIFQEQYCANCTTVAPLSQTRLQSQEEDSDNSFNLFTLYETTSEIFEATQCNESRIEFTKYCKEKRADKNVNILEWWRKKSVAFPKMAKMARDFLSIPATSVPADRLFSKAGLIMRKRRNKLHNESARSFLCINGWMTCSMITKIQQNLNRPV